MAAATAQRHATRALLRAHLSAASGYRHLTRHCPICHRLLRLAMEPSEAEQGPAHRKHARTVDGAVTGPRGASDGPTANDPGEAPRGGPTDALAALAAHTPGTEDEGPDRE
ncbi:DUF6274 family protein [Streptomyces clavuligerus]|nr:DUF6274 family protein [Streptomyces clavuligerus]AXU13664.1 hypothetical protein D1794_13520 [Streptomyces clavuligerus]EDY49489.1 hypothetical protein SSCG_02517 [Streptomyces clavuligerus]MBY6303634.1 hypothetical protein [Streptomyces clavuligerus]QCS06449.1 hypothetical protein CRV15_12955 [Streptomyces clavuligerus]QPJ94196.1 hypothetical protein GE265_15040 [Streptomyces clavuligerus]